MELQEGSHHRVSSYTYLQASTVHNTGCVQPSHIPLIIYILSFPPGLWLAGVYVLKFKLTLTVNTVLGYYGLSFVLSERCCVLYQRRLCQYMGKDGCPATSDIECVTARLYHTALLAAVLNESLTLLLLVFSRLLLLLLLPLQIHHCTQMANHSHVSMVRNILFIDCRAPLYWMNVVYLLAVLFRASKRCFVLSSLSW